MTSIILLGVLGALIPFGVLVTSMSDSESPVSSKSSNSTVSSSMTPSKSSDLAKKIKGDKILKDDENILKIVLEQDKDSHSKKNKPLDNKQKVENGSFLSDKEKSKAKESSSKSLGFVSNEDENENDNDSKKQDCSSSSENSILLGGQTVGNKNFSEENSKSDNSEKPSVKESSASEQNDDQGQINVDELIETSSKLINYLNYMGELVQKFDSVDSPDENELIENDLDSQMEQFKNDLTDILQDFVKYTGAAYYDRFRQSIQAKINTLLGINDHQELYDYFLQGHKNKFPDFLSAGNSLLDKKCVFKKRYERLGAKGDEEVTIYAFEDGTFYRNIQNLSKSKMFEH